MTIKEALLNEIKPECTKMMYMGVVISIIELDGASLDKSIEKIEHMLSKIIDKDEVKLLVAETKQKLEPLMAFLSLCERFVDEVWKLKYPPNSNAT